MKLGTIVYNNEIFNLDYMTEEEIQEVIVKIEEKKKKNFYEIKNRKYN